jgi:hypothetical protein
VSNELAGPFRANTGHAPIAIKLGENVIKIGVKIDRFTRFTKAFSKKVEN